MTKRVKRLLFYSAVAVFLVLSYVIILYAEGYKYSFAGNRFFKTGAMYLKVNTDADVYMNDKFLGNTSFFGNSYRIEGLLPTKYTIRVKKDNFSVWQKSITVDEGFVSEFSKIIILPNSGKELEELDKEISLVFPAPIKGMVKPSPTPSNEPFITKKGILSTTGERSEKIADNVKGFVLSKDKNKLAWWTANELWVMWLNDTNYQPYRKKGDQELITRFSAQIKKAAWFRDEDHLIVELNPSTGSTISQQASSGQAGYKVLEIDTRGGINIIEI